MKKFVSFAVAVCLMVGFGFMSAEAAKPVPKTITVTVTTNAASYSVGQVVQTTAVAKYSDGTPVTSIKSTNITIKDSAGATKVSASMTNAGNGVFTHSYTILDGSVGGTWTATCTVTDTSRASGTGSTTFTVAVPVGHASLTWTGYGMCSTSICHPGRANDMHNSVHYQWKGSAAEMTTGPNTQGKMDALDGSSALNAYCVNIQGTWAPCGSCHVGAGAKPTSTLTPSNIDCLMCHNDTINAPYSRVRNTTTGLFEPAAGLNMDLVVQKANIKPTRKNCLGACHAKAGGGDGVKRGDLALATVTFSNPADDAHMATGGGNFACQACHTFTSHKVIGRGSDLRPQDSATDLNCSSAACHPTKTTSTGHTTADINYHVGRVACQSCHIKTYARGFLTETDRDWSAPAEWNATLNRYEPHHVMAGNLTPKYAFWNGTSWGNNVGDAAVLDSATGAYKISRPNGAINDPEGTKFYPFKYKTSHQPLASGKLIALKVGTFFSTANYDQAVKDGMAYMGIPTTTPYSTVLTDELQVLNHQVEPSSSAMTCAGCHENTTVNLRGMGYTLKAATSVVCSQCHNAKTPGSYTRIHSHSLNKGYDCSWCHTFSRPERGLTMP